MVRVPAAVALTLVPAALASPGRRFRFMGPNEGPECQGCPFQKLCFGLDKGRTYEVSTLRPVVHPCALHDEGRVQVAVVQEAPLSTSVEARMLRGTAVRWTGVPCGRPDCPSWGLCHPVGAPAGASYTVEGQDGALPCPAGFDLQRVRLRLLRQ